DDLSAGATRVLTATLKDAFGNVVDQGDDASLEITFALSDDSDGSVTGLGSETAVGGVAQITVTGNQAGTVTVEASTQTALEDAVSFDVVAVDADALLIDEAPAETVAGESIAGADEGSPAVRVEDA